MEKITSTTIGAPEKKQFLHSEEYNKWADTLVKSFGDGDIVKVGEFSSVTETKNFVNFSVHLDDERLKDFDIKFGLYAAETFSRRVSKLYDAGEKLQVQVSLNKPMSMFNRNYLTVSVFKE